ncbi:winged helix-turn-helix transcriptional regulator [Natronorubrum daqingense]|uniref:Transcriptional regulator, HxlR family n=1 Tax=Natronorubrum daqingense TaxID=588898 RepID=A0A1N7GAP6_9EURY|nr:winged helix-turn-helix transcriptional regulator [Natronorubrum daqingense]APX98504.1 hypothetical protein BB347_17465 [Natronorubrum daqingense]SIS09584.1 transcriptional regulator, HxlR family [Natronorubrum daqingense]
MVKQISGYLEMSGAIGLLVHLKYESRRFNELKDLVGVSPSTLTTRLNEGRDLGLITTRIGEDEYDLDQRSIHHEYMITDRGELVLEKMDEFEVTYAYKQLREAEQKLVEGRENLRVWIEDNEDEIAQAEDEHSTRDKYGEDVTEPAEVDGDYSEFMEKD